MSLCYEPVILVPSNPEPISKPFVAGILSIAWAIKAGNLSKQGSPKPTGTPVIQQVIVPPMESFSFYTLWITSSILIPVSGCGQRILTSS